MASTSVYVDLRNSVASSSTQGDAIKWPTFVAGDQVNLDIRFLSSDGNGGKIIDNEIVGRVAGIRLAIGPIKNAPSSGTYRLSLNGVTSSAIDYNAGAKDIQDALRQASGISDLNCYKTGAFFVVSKPDGSRLTISLAENNLQPVTYISISEQGASGKFSYLLSFLPTPLAFSDSTTRVLPQAPTLTVVQHGGMDPSGVAQWPTIHDLYIPANFSGTFQLQNGLTKTDLLDITSSAADIKSALNAVLNASAGVSVSTSNPQAQHCYITWDGTGVMGTDVALGQVVVFTAPPPDWGISISLATKAILQAVANENAPISAVFEAEADFYISRPITGQPLPTTFKQKLWSAPITINPPLIWPEFSTAQSIDWLQPNGSTGYIPFNRDQIITGIQSYTCVIGNGTSTSFEIPHNLNTPSLAAVFVAQNRGGGSKIPESQYTCVVENDNAIRLDFITAPASGALAVTILASGPTSAFQAHTHTIAQVTDLQLRLDDIFTRLALFESLVQRDASALAVNSGQPDQKIVLPPFGEILPDLSLEDSVVSIASQLISAVPVNASAVVATPSVVPGTPLQVMQNQNKANLIIETEKASAFAENIKTNAKAIAQNSALAQTSINLITYTIPAIDNTWPSKLIDGKFYPIPQAYSGTAQSFNFTGEITQELMRTYSPGAYVYQGTSIEIQRSLTQKSSLILNGGDFFGWNGKIIYPVYISDGRYYPSDLNRDLFNISLPRSISGKISLSFAPTLSLEGVVFDDYPGYSCKAKMQIVAGGAVLFETNVSFNKAQENFTLSVDATINGDCVVTCYGVAKTGGMISDGSNFLIRIVDFDSGKNNALAQFKIKAPVTSFSIN